MYAFRRGQIEIARRNIANGIPDARWCGNWACDLNGMEHGHGRTSHPVFNGVDLSGYVTNMQLGHDGDDKEPWCDTLAGLKQSSFTVSGTFDNTAGYFPPPPSEHKVRVSYETPDGRWQTFKWRLKRHWPFRWLKVRFITYTWEGVLEPWDGSSASLEVRGGGSISRSDGQR